MKLPVLPRESILIAAGAAVLATAAFYVPAAARTPVTPRPATTAAFAGGVAGSYVVGADNLDASDPFNDYGVEGKVDNDVGGVGVLGYGQQSKSYGVYGVSFGTNGIGSYGAADGPTPAPMTTPNADNQSTGVVGDAHGGDGMYGSTEWAGSADPFKNPIAGVVGIDTSSAARNNDGVYGRTDNGAFGVAGYASGDAVAAIGGFSTTADGVDGSSSSGNGMLAESSSGYGMLAESSQSAGVFGESDGSLAEGVGGVNFQGGAGVAGSSSSGNGIYGTSGATTPSSAAVYAQGGLVSVQAIASTDVGSSSTSFPLLAYSSDGTQIFTVTNSGLTEIYGDLKVHGTTTTYGRTRDPQNVVSEYAASSSRPTTEDFGEGRVIAGTGYVRLDPAFVRSIDDRTPYKVFVTPEGDTKGYYVTGKTLSGFAVRETQGGHSTFDFDYRIVATKYGESSRRLAVVREADTFAAPRRSAIPAPRRLQANAHHSSRGATKFSLLVSHAVGTKETIFVPRPNFGVEHRTQ